MPIDPASLPSDPEAERRIIGSCLLGGQGVAAALGLLESSDFSCRPYQLAFVAVANLSAANEPVNGQSVIRKMEQLDSVAFKEMPAGLILTSTEGVLAEEAAFWAGHVKRKRSERDMVEFAEWARGLATSGEGDIPSLMGRIEERLAKIGAKPEASTSSIADNMDLLRARIDNYIESPGAITGMETGWVDFDRMLDGLQPGNVSIVYAPSSRYKSYFVQNLGLRLAQRGHAGLWYTTEMPNLQVRERIAQLQAGLNFRWLRRDNTIGEYRRQILNAIDDIENLPIYFCDDTDLDIAGIRSTVTRFKRWHDIEYTIVDLVDMVSSSQFQDNDVSNQSVVMKKFKGIAKATGTHVILVSHIAKSDKALRGKPVLDVEDMKGSSSKYQDVDHAISLMPVGLDPETGQDRGLTVEQISYEVQTKGWLTMLAYITKNRQGEVGGIKFRIDLNAGGQMAPLYGQPKLFVPAQPGMPGLPLPQPGPNRRWA